jgi:hypothetical protein
MAQVKWLLIVLFMFFPLIQCDAEQEAPVELKAPVDNPSIGISKYNYFVQRQQYYKALEVAESYSLDFKQAEIAAKKSIQNWIYRHVYHQVRVGLKPTHNSQFLPDIPNSFLPRETLKKYKLDTQILARELFFIIGYELYEEVDFQALFYISDTYFDQVESQALALELYYDYIRRQDYQVTRRLAEKYDFPNDIETPAKDQGDFNQLMYDYEQKKIGVAALLDKIKEYEIAVVGDNADILAFLILRQEQISLRLAEGLYSYSSQVSSDRAELAAKIVVIRYLQANRLYDALKVLRETQVDFDSIKQALAVAGRYVDPVHIIQIQAELKAKQN